MEDNIVKYGRGVEKALLRLLSKTKGLKIFGQDLENFSEADAFQLEDEISPSQVKALTPRVIRKDVGFKIDQWHRYKEFSKKYPKFTCYVLTTSYNPKLDFDYRLYEFDIKQMNPTFKQDGFVYIKLDEMKLSDVEIPEGFQRVIEEQHKKCVRPTMNQNMLKGYKDKF